MGREPVRWLRGLRSEAEGGMAGFGGSGWEEAVGGGVGTSRHIRASEQAGVGHIDIDPLPRYEMAHWPAMAAASLGRRGRERGIGGKREAGGPAENGANRLAARGVVLLLRPGRVVPAPAPSCSLNIRPFSGPFFLTPI